MAYQIMRELSKANRSSLYFTIMADECTDISNKEQFTICVRWVDESLVNHEDFLSLYLVNDIGASTLTDTIKDTLIRMGLSLSQCHGQCYDRASNMSGSRSGVANRLLAEEKRAVYTLCYGHALNLAIRTIMKQSKPCCEAMEVAFKVSS